MDWKTFKYSGVERTALFLGPDSRGCGTLIFQTEKAGVEEAGFRTVKDEKVSEARPTAAQWGRIPTEVRQAIEEHERAEAKDRPGLWAKLLEILKRWL